MTSNKNRSLGPSSARSKYPATLMKDHRSSIYWSTEDCALRSKCETFEWVTQSDILCRSGLKFGGGTFPKCRENHWSWHVPLLSLTSLPSVAGHTALESDTLLALSTGTIWMSSMSVPSCSCHLNWGTFCDLLCSEAASILLTFDWQTHFSTAWLTKAFWLLSLLVDKLAVITNSGVLLTYTFESWSAFQTTSLQYGSISWSAF